MILKEIKMTDLEIREAFTAWIKKEYLGIEILANQRDEGAITRRDYTYVGWQAAKAQTVPINNTTIVAVERMVEQQVKASGITADVFRLDGEKILNAAVEAARSGK